MHSRGRGSSMNSPIPKSIMMKRQKVLIIVGTRPEIIKMAPVVHELCKHPGVFEIKVCLTGQHREMVDQSIAFLDIHADYHLDIMTKGQSLSGLTARLCMDLNAAFQDFNPDLVLVQGDTTTAFIGALIAYYKRIRVGHVEAGLRTYNKYAPFPEEKNRCLIGVLADHHFAPTPRAKQALLREGINESQILVTGNTVVDALIYILKKIETSPPSLGDLESVVSNGRRSVLITGHRRENFGEGFKNICTAIKSLAQGFPDVNFIYPVHLNPEVQKPVNRVLGNIGNIYLVPPMGYVPFIRLMKESSLILTDSGGIQEEAPSLGKPVLVMRETTERPEATEAGTAILVGTDISRIIQEGSRLLNDETAWRDMSKKENPYGDGKAARRIADYLGKYRGLAW
jgi:UDP-N-acetylglucosamine 2-epimerase (non-hydrolysing)